MLAFMVCDLCTPEECQLEIVSSTTNSSTLVQAQQGPSDSDSNSCQFEEDCFNCAHYVAGSFFFLKPIALVDFTVPDLLVASLDRPPVLPYHPPRA
jgi:hypothetical protein